MAQKLKKKRGRPAKERARQNDGTYQKDDPSTPNINEAFVSAPVSIADTTGTNDPCVKALFLLENVTMKSVGIQTCIKILRKET